MPRASPSMRSTSIERALCLAFGASCVLRAASAYGACDNTAPLAGQTATCDTRAPNPSTQPIATAPASANVTINVSPGAVLNVTSGSAISVRNTSTLNNAGTIQGATGVSIAGGAATIDNSGTIRGTSGAGIVANGRINVSIVNTGTIAGGAGVAVSTDTGNDTFVMNGGVVSGQIRQGNGFDTFTMTAGQVGSLDQGDTRDDFTMTGGRIVGVFVNGDIARMTGGRIGTVDLNVGNNVFDMSGGQVDGNVTAAQNNDTFTLSGGTIGGRVDLGSGTNALTITGGSIGMGVTTTFGPDTLTWSGGTISGPVSLGAGADAAIIRNLNDTTLGALTRFDGGPGTDALTFDNVQASGLARFTGWESIDARNGTQLTFDANGLTLGDAVTGTDTLDLDTTSTLFAGGIGATALLPAVAGQRVTLNNAGVIDLTNGGASTRDTFTVNGNYIGANGRLLVQSALGADGAPSDRLVIAQGAGSGTTSIGVTNVGGKGGSTVNDGILVVQATGGGTTSAGAFSLARPLEAGAFTYYLFKGGASAGTSENWYLRSSVAAVPSIPAAPVTPQTPGTPTTPTTPENPGTPTPPATPIPAPQAAPGTPALPPAPPPGAAPTPLYRMEVPVYAEVPPLARELAIQQVGTFHERQGDQALLTENGALPAAWARAWGGHATLHNSGAADPEFSGGIGGVQIGHDLYADTTTGGHRNHYGFFLGFARASGDISGLALGFPNADAGHLSMNAYSAGLYWTHIGPGGWYTDTVVLGSALTVDPQSNRGVGATTHGNAFAASFEAGLPIPLPAGLGIEPQAQLIWQHVNLNDIDDGISTVSFSEAGGLTGRLGVRFYGRFDAAGTAFEPYLRANLWRYFGATDTATFAGTTVIPTEVSATIAQFGAGVTAKVSARGSLFANLAYSMNVGGGHRSAIEGGAGMRWKW